MQGGWGVVFDGFSPKSAEARGARAGGEHRSCPPHSYHEASDQLQVRRGWKNLGHGTKFKERVTEPPCPSLLFRPRYRRPAEAWGLLMCTPEASLEGCTSSPAPNLPCLNPIADKTVWGPPKGKRERLAPNRLHPGILLRGPVWG